MGCWIQRITPGSPVALGFHGHASSSLSKIPTSRAKNAREMGHPALPRLGCARALAAEHFAFLRFLEKRLPFILQSDAGAFGEGLRGFEGVGGLLAITGLQSGLGEFYGRGQL